MTPRSSGQEEAGYSVAFPKRWWYPACRSSDLGSLKPHAITLMGTPVVLFRDRFGAAHALVDRCPHRNVPLSLGRVHADGTLQCGYHGWRFDGGGHCRAVPGLYEDDDADAAARCVATHATTEVDGFVWVWGEAAAEPSGRPFELPDLGPRTSQTVFACDLECTLTAALENSLDVPHTAFLHGGLLRGGQPSEVTAVRREVAGGRGVEVQYLGEPVGLGKWRAKPGGKVTLDHWDRFFLPSIAQIEYRAGTWLRIVNTILHLPLSPLRTRAWFVLRTHSPVPAAVVRPIVAVRGRRVLGQDAGMLARQTEQIGRFGGEQYASTDLDLMANPIWWLLRQAERAESGQPVVVEPNGTSRANGSGSDGVGAGLADGDVDFAGRVTPRTVTFRA